MIAKNATMEVLVSEQLVMQNASPVDPMTAAIRRTAQEVATIGEAEQRLAIRDLPGLLSEHKHLAAAWERGRMLRRLRELAEGPICEKVVAQRLGLDGEAAFVKMLDSDPEARDIWRQGRHGFFMQSKRAIMAGVEEGKAHCLRLVEQIIRAESGTSGPVEPVDFTRLSITQMAAATGILRQQITRWTRKHGLPANPDGSYSLPVFITWLRHADVGKARRYRRRPGAVEKRIIARCAAVVREELNREPDNESDGQ